MEGKTKIRVTKKRLGSQDRESDKDAIGKVGYIDGYVTDKNHHVIVLAVIGNTVWNLSTYIFEVISEGDYNVTKRLFQDNIEEEREKEKELSSEYRTTFSYTPEEISEDIKVDFEIKPVEDDDLPF